MSLSVVRPKCLENLKDGFLPQKWMGKKIAPIFSWGGCDVDFKMANSNGRILVVKNGIKNENRKKNPIIKIKVF